MPSIHATAYLRDPPKHDPGPAVALVGSDPFLKSSAIVALQRAILGEESAGGLTRLSGPDADVATVLDELRTVSMWSDRRLIVIEDADEFVSKHRAALERYLDAPARKSVLVLEVKSFPKTTKIAKKVAKDGLVLECGPLEQDDLVRWLIGESTAQFGKTLGRGAATYMTEIIGPDFGILGQELAKLAAYVGDRPKIELDDARKLVGGWAGEEVWDMIRNTYGGNVGRAIDDLHLLLESGESPNKILGAISYVFVRIVRGAEIARRGKPLPAALREAGVYPKDVDRAAAYVRRTDPRKLDEIYNRLLEADAALKGGSRASEPQTLERLLVEFAPKT